MSETARKYVWWGVAGGVLQFALLALIAFSGSDEPAGEPEDSAVAESRTTVQASAAHATERTASEETPTDEPAPAAAAARLADVREKLKDSAGRESAEAEPATDQAPDQVEETPAAATPVTSSAAGAPQTRNEDKTAPGTEGGQASPETDQAGADGAEPEEAEPAVAQTDQAPAPEDPAEPAAASGRAPITVPANLGPAGIEQLIRDVFGEAADKAIEVARCESEMKTDARRGQFLGLFQMGANERADYGHGSEPMAQIEAAYRLFLARGWQPWTCA